MALLSGISGKMGTNMDGIADVELWHLFARHTILIYTAGPSVLSAEQKENAFSGCLCWKSTESTQTNYSAARLKPFTNHSVYLLGAAMLNGGWAYRRHYFVPCVLPRHGLQYYKI